MFIVGMELDLNVLRQKAHDAVVISHASIIIPFSLGMVLAYFIYQTYAPEGVQFLSFGLFMGIAMSITAFPVLARIVQERGIQKTRLGATAITCAAADDVTAWCLLAVVVAIVKAGSAGSALYIILLAIVYVAIMIKWIRPLLAKLGARCFHEDGTSKRGITIFFLTLIISAYLAEAIGIHALFGAFLAGTIMPEQKNFRKLFTEKNRRCCPGIVVAPVFRVYRFENRNRTVERCCSLENDWSHHFGSHRWEIRRKRTRCPGGGTKLERQPFDRCINEYPGTHGTGRIEHWLRFGSADTRSFCHDGDDGTLNYFYDRTDFNANQSDF